MKKKLFGKEIFFVEPAKLDSKEFEAIYSTRISEFTPKKFVNLFKKK